MKNIVLAAFLWAYGFILHAQTIQPYIFGATKKGNFELIKEETRLALQASGLEVVGEYKPARDPFRYVFSVTSIELKNAVYDAGLIYGFGLIQHIALTIEEGLVEITATNPVFWGKAYFGSQYLIVSRQIERFDKKLDDFFHIIGKYRGVGFGAVDDFSDEQLEQFQLLVGFPKYLDMVELENFKSFNEAIKTIETNFLKNNQTIIHAYTLKLDKQKLAVFGFGITGFDGEEGFINQIDIDFPKKTAFFPMEILVVDTKVYQLSRYFRIPLGFPNLGITDLFTIYSIGSKYESAADDLVDN